MTIIDEISKKGNGKVAAENAIKDAEKSIGYAFPDQWAGIGAIRSLCFDSKFDNMAVCWA